MTEKVTLELLQQLQALQVEHLISRLKQDTADGIPTDAATLGVIAKVLKDNNVTVDPADGDSLKEMRERLAAQSQARARGGNIIDMAQRQMNGTDN